MADNYVENFSFGEDEDEQTFQVKDPEAIEAEGGELANAIITYDNEETSVQSFTDFISNFVSGTKVAKWFKDFKAGVEYILHVGSLVNNCVTDNAELPLSAAQGKVLMDEITSLNSNINTGNIPYFSLTASQAVQIPADSDLDDYAEPGNYYIRDNATAVTVSNWPCSFGGALKVFWPLSLESATAAYPLQVAISFRGGIYTRWCQVDRVAWTDWVTVSDGYV